LGNGSIVDGEGEWQLLDRKPGTVGTVGTVEPVEPGPEGRGEWCRFDGFYGFPVPLKTLPFQMSSIIFEIDAATMPRPATVYR
jgi:hypothetical protein